MLTSPLQSPSISPSSSPTTATTSITTPTLSTSLSSSSVPPPGILPKQKPRRNYIQRKKCLNNSVSQIVNVLNFIQILQKDSVSPIEKQKVAYAHAQKIEAACWSPHSKLTPESYEKLISAKTAELCRVILKKSIPQMDSNKVQQLKQQLVSKNPMVSLTINSAQFNALNNSNNSNNANSNNKAIKVKNETSQSSNLNLEQNSNNDISPATKNSTKTGPLTINTSHNVNLTIFDSNSNSLPSNNSLTTLMLNNNQSSPEINNNRIQVAQLKEMAPSYQSFLIPIEKPEPVSPINNNLPEFEIMDQKFSIDETGQDFSIDPLLITQPNAPTDMFTTWPQKDQDLFRPYIL